MRGGSQSIESLLSLEEAERVLPLVFRRLFRGREYLLAKGARA